VIAHEHFGLDIDIIWDIIRTRIPVLAEQVRQIKLEWNIRALINSDVLENLKHRVFLY